MSDASPIEVEVAERGGRPVVIKRAMDEAGARRLVREAGRLSAASHPGVVELLAHDAASLTLAWAGDQTLETYRPALAPAAALLTVLAETVADLHDLGVVHGRICADHVVIGSGGRPRLCGMAGADPDAEQPEPADDVAALGRLIDLLMGSDAEAEPIPERRWGRRRWTGYQRRALQTLADQATDPNQGHRPRARDLAAALAAVVPDAHLGADVEESPDLADRRAPELSHPVDPDLDLDLDPDSDSGLDGAEDKGDGANTADEPWRDVPWDEVETFLGMRLADEVEGVGPDRPASTGSGSVRDRRSRSDLAAAPSSRTAFRRVAAVAAGLLLAVLVVSVVRPDSRRERPTLPPEVAEVQTTETPTEPTADAPQDGTRLTPAPVDPRCAPVAPPSADVDGDGCPEAVGVTGSTIQAGTVRYRLGSEGDDVTVGDWDCDGQATPALVRPSTGEVFVFSRWATAEEPLSLAPTAVVPDVAAPVPAQECGPLQVRSASGAITTVPEATR